MWCKSCLASAVILSVCSAYAAVQVGGSEPFTNTRPGAAQAEKWPEGILPVVDAPSRVQWMLGPPFGGGQYTFSYQGDTDTFNQVLELFGQIVAPALELVLYEGTAKDGVAGSDRTFDWQLEFWDAQAYYEQHLNPAPLPQPFPRAACRCRHPASTSTSMPQARCNGNR